jgi:prolyl-tRNA editing enzyme YbaK/EbsC (Cys-tRNA(Pro) deacylase)
VDTIFNNLCQKKLDIYLDISLKEFTTVYPAGGSPNSAVEIDVSYLK